MEGTQIGDSIAINGVCLTVVDLQRESAAFDVSPETLSKSTLQDLRPGAQINAERALRVGDRLGGHFVQGHVDGVAKLDTLVKDGEFWTLRFTLDPTLGEQLILKGSVAIDGVSLTVAELEAERFSVAVIPETARMTTLCRKQSGDKVNIEIDMLVKAVRQTCQTMLSTSSSLTLEKFRALGF
jgi:riboflavin synthase